MVPLRSPRLVAFGVATVIHLVLNAADATPWDSITKCLLAPLLIGWVRQQRGPRLLVAALVGCLVGDLFLELGDDLFVVGMAAFAAAHGCFIALFVQRGAVARLRARPWIVGVYAVAAVVMVAWCWTGLEAGLRPVVPVYAALLVGTAATSLAVGARPGAGGAMFLISDGVIALGEAGRLDPGSVAAGLAIMALYAAAILLLATGVVQRSRRTDCWPAVPSAEAA